MIHESSLELEPIYTVLSHPPSESGVILSGVKQK